MKSLKTLLLAGLSLMAFTTVYAQEEEEVETDLTTLQFVDADGNVIADGTTVNFAPTDPKETPEGFEIKPDIFVENLTDEPVYTVALVNVTAMSSGSLSCCFPMNCRKTYELEEFTTDLSDIKAKAKHPFNTEWYAEEYGSCTASFQLKIYEDTLAPGQFVPTKVLRANGPKITVNFIYNDPASINGVSNDGAKAVAFYNANGQQINNLQKGLNFIKYSNGKTVKTVIK